MFSHPDATSTRNLIFQAGFHTGIPFAVCSTRDSSGWNEVRNELAHLFAADARFRVLDPGYAPETNFPLGEPLTLEYKDLFASINLLQWLSDAGVTRELNRAKLDNIVAIYPTGVVIVSGRIRLDPADALDLQIFSNVIELHYAELSFAFLVVARVLVAGFSAKTIAPHVCRRDLDRCLDGIANATAETSLGDPRVREKLEALLVDVYYIQWLSWIENDTWQVGYVDATVESIDPNYVLVISIAFSSWLGFLWLTKNLSEKSRLMRRELARLSPMNRDLVSDVKLMRVYSLEFISESRPISIRLTRAYMSCLEQCWNEFRLKLLVEQINDQLAVLEKMVDWAEDAERETRNLKISLAAILLAVISVTAVAAQLISTIDVQVHLGAKERIGLILVGFIIGIICTLAIYAWPGSRPHGRRVK